MPQSIAGTILRVFVTVYLAVDRCPTKYRRARNIWEAKRKINLQVQGRRALLCTSTLSTAVLLIIWYNTYYSRSAYTAATGEEREWGRGKWIQLSVGWDKVVHISVCRPLAFFGAPRPPYPCLKSSADTAAVFVAVAVACCCYSLCPFFANAAPGCLGLLCCPFLRRCCLPCIYILLTA